MVLEVSVLGKGGGWSLGQPLVGDTPGRSFRVWSKVMSAVVENHMGFETQLLEWYWVLLEMGLLTIGC